MEKYINYAYIMYILSEIHSNFINLISQKWSKTVSAGSSCMFFPKLMAIVIEVNHTPKMGHFL